jgi:hypothetical protein
MAIVNTFVARTTNGASSATAFVDNRVVVEIDNESVMNGSRVVIQTSSVNTSAKFYRTSPGIIMTSPSARTIELKAGMFIRLVVENAGPTTSINANIIT